MDRPAWIVSFANPQIPAWFTIWVDKQTYRTLRMRMTESAHFMVHQYGPLDTPLHSRLRPADSMCRVNRRRAAWLLSIPLMVAGSQIAHVFAYRLVYPQAPVRLHALLETGHGYMTGYAGYLPLVFGVVGGIELVVFGWVAVGTIGRRRQRPVPAWAFALVPVLGFTVQEFVERWLAGAAFPWWMVLQPTFRVGLLLQLPFSLIAFLLAWLLLRAAERVARALQGSTDNVPSFRDGPGWFVVAVCPRRSPVLAGRHAGRAPPPGGSATALLSC